MDIARLNTVSGLALCVTMLSACQLTDNAYFVKPDSSPATLTGVAELANLPPATPSLLVGVTFKSAGKISTAASDSLYQSVCSGLQAKGHWQIRRLGKAGDDFAAQIAAIKPVPTMVATKVEKPSAKTPAAAPVNAAKLPPRILVLVENSPDKSTATTASYVLSGMSYGGARVHKPTDRYDVTIAYRDAEGVDHVYRGHQDLVFATGSRLFGQDPSPGPGYKRFSSSTEAFNGIVDNSVNGSRRGKVTVGPAQVEKPASTPVPPPKPISVANTTAQTAGAKKPVAKTTRGSTGIQLLAADDDSQ